MKNTPLKPTKMLSPRRRAFQYAAAGFLAVNLGVPAIIGPLNDRTGEQTTRTGFNETTLRSITGAKFNIHYIEDKSTYIIPLLQGQFSLYSTMKDYYNNAQSPHGYEAFGVSLKTTFYGYRGLLDRATLHLTSKMSQCSVVIPSDRLKLETLQSTMTGLDPKNIHHFPGTLKDYNALIFLPSPPYRRASAHPVFHKPVLAFDLRLFKC